MKETDPYNKEYSYDSNSNHSSKNNSDNKKVWGIIIIIIGFYLLLKTIIPNNFPFLNHFISFPILMIIGGIILGSRRRFQMGGWVFLTGAGVFLFISRLDHSFTTYLFPITLIIVGIYIINNNKEKKKRILKEEIKALPPPSGEQKEQQTHFTQTDYSYIDTSETININNILGGDKRNVLSKDFRGGSISSVFGSVEIDMRSAGLVQDIQININLVFGSIEFLFPANWQIINETTTLLGSVEDRRRVINTDGNLKKVYITGLVLFGSIDIKNV
ncbi:MAG TPA: LiaF domain-containing protein [Edaphocola sp.]|nr:LiaF domain-containing protein [Edaphocola sp.]